MEEFVNVAVIENAVEANLLDGVLTQQGIPHAMRSYYDTAYDGVFQVQKGWGCVLAPEPRRAEIVAIIADLRQSQDES